MAEAGSRARNLRIASSRSLSSSFPVCRPPPPFPGLQSDDPPLSDFFKEWGIPRNDQFETLVVRYQFESHYAVMILDCSMFLFRPASSVLWHGKHAEKIGRHGR
jgi:hypothetical protein